MRLSQKQVPAETRLLEIIRKKENHSEKANRLAELFLRLGLAAIGQIQKWSSEPLIFAKKFFMALTFSTILFGIVEISLSSSKERGPVFQEMKESSEEIKASSALPPFHYYASVINRRTLFKTLWADTPSQQSPAYTQQYPPVQQYPSAQRYPSQANQRQASDSEQKSKSHKAVTLAELAGDLELVGVINAGEPQAIIVNKKSQQTHTLSVGQTMGEIKVIKISGNRVTLKYKEETIDLSM